MDRHWDIDSGISIHAPLRGRLQPSRPPRTGAGFQSTPPCGGDGRQGRLPGEGVNFNPRPLAGATIGDVDLMAEVRISIHAPLRGRPCIMSLTTTFLSFQSTPPCGGDVRRHVVVGLVVAISIHAPLRGRRPMDTIGAHAYGEFQSTPPCGGDCLVFCFDSY